jgi:hypothetical protein
MKPVGLTDPRTGRRPHAVVQLRQENALATLYNLVGFQTKLRHGEQKRIFRMIPRLERVESARLGGLHRNTFINSPRLLDGRLRLKAMPRLRFAGQITGVEGYVESAAIGLIAGRLAAASRLGHDMMPPPATTALGALLGHITGGAESRGFQPMNVNFGLFPPPSPDPAGTPTANRCCRGARWRIWTVGSAAANRQPPLTRMQLDPCLAGIPGTCIVRCGASVRIDIAGIVPPGSPQCISSDRFHEFAVEQ